MFFDVDVYLTFLADCRAHGITVPIMPGAVSRVCWRIVQLTRSRARCIIAAAWPRHGASSPQHGPGSNDACPNPRFTALAPHCAAGVTLPPNTHALAGLMLIQSYAGFKRMVVFCKSRVPSFLHDQLDAVKDDDAKVRETGTRIGVAMCKALLDAGVRGLHLYTLNLEEVTYGVLRALGMYKEPAAAAAAGAAGAAAAGTST